MLCLSVLLLDRYSDYLSAVKSSAIDLARPLYDLSDMPHRLMQWADDKVQSQDDLAVKNAQLEAEALVLRAKVQKLAALTIENVRLRELLNAGAVLKERVLLTEVIAVSANPLQHYVMIDKGREDGVFVGQGVVDAYGLFGQVMEIASHSSRVLLISDSRHAVPAQITRNGLRLIVEGRSQYDYLDVPNATPTMDIEKGDIVYTSGLGGVFPEGYPLGRISSVQHEAGHSFSQIKLEPMAHLDRSRQLLLLFPREVE